MQLPDLDADPDYDDALAGQSRHRLRIRHEPVAHALELDRVAEAPDREPLIGRARRDARVVDADQTCTSAARASSDAPVMLEACAACRRDSD